MESHPQGAAGSTPKGGQPRSAMAGVLLFVILQTAYPMSSAIVLSQDGPQQAAGETSINRLSDRYGTVPTRQKDALCLTCY